MAEKISKNQAQFYQNPPGAGQFLTTNVNIFNFYTYKVIFQRGKDDFTDYYSIK